MREREREKSATVNYLKVTVLNGITVWLRTTPAARRHIIVRRIRDVNILPYFGWFPPSAQAIPNIHTLCVNFRLLSKTDRRGSAQSQQNFISKTLYYPTHCCACVYRISKRYILRVNMVLKQDYSTVYRNFRQPREKFNFEKYRPIKRTYTL